MTVGVRDRGDECVGISAHGALVGEGHAVFAFGESSSVRGYEQRQMGKTRRRASEQGCEQGLSSFGASEIMTAHDIGDVHGEVIDDDGELIREDPIAASKHEIARRFRDIFGLRAEHEVDRCDDSSRVLGHGEADGGRSSEGTFLHAKRPTSAWIPRTFVACVGRAGDACDVSA